MLAQTTLSYIFQISYYALKAYLLLLLTAPITAVYQESKIWNPHPKLPSLSIFGMIKVYMITLIWMTFTSIATVILLPKVILKGWKGVERDAHCLMERMAGIACTIIVAGPVQIRNAHNLPVDGTSCVYIANHASQIDLAVVYFIFRRFKWISKSSVKYLPGVGLLMTMAGHVFIERSRKSKDKSITVKKMYDEAKKEFSRWYTNVYIPTGYKTIR